MIDLSGGQRPTAEQLQPLLEEYGLLDRIKPINIARGDQLSAVILQLSPNRRMLPTITRSPT